MSAIALQRYSEPLLQLLEADSVTELCINQEQAVWIEQAGVFTKKGCPLLTLNYLSQWARLIAEYNHKAITPESPLLAATLPGGHRVQLVIPPACDKHQFICSIRRHAMKDVPLSQYVSSTSDRSTNHDQLMSYYQQGDTVNFLKSAIHTRQNIILSGGTSTGKTTLLNTLLKEVPVNERIITIEDAREVRVTQPNAVHLLATGDNEQALARVNMLDLLKASLRLRPDRLFVSELRGHEAFAYLRAVNSGHPGSMTTLHADSPAGCFDQLMFMVLQSGTTLAKADILNYVKRVIPIVVQITRQPNNQRVISDVYYAPAASSSFTNNKPTRTII